MKRGQRLRGASRGFTRADLDEGWQLLRAVADVQMGARPAQPADPTVLDELDAWENEWFPLADAMLTRHFPKLREQVFLNPSQTEGIQVIISVSTFLKRLAALEASGDEGRRAAERLRRCGLTPEVQAAARAMLDRASAPDVELSGPDLAARREAAELSERKLWDLYLEWSRIARLVIHDRRQLRQLGFLSARSASSDDLGEDEEAPARDVAAADDEPRE